MTRLRQLRESWYCEVRGEGRPLTADRKEWGILQKSRRAQPICWIPSTLDLPVPGAMVGTGLGPTQGFPLLSCLLGKGHPVASRQVPTIALC